MVKLQVNFYCPRKWLKYKSICANNDNGLWKKINFAGMEDVFFNCIICLHPDMYMYLLSDNSKHTNKSWQVSKKHFQAIFASNYLSHKELHLSDKICKQE